MNQSFFTILLPGTADPQILSLEEFEKCTGIVYDAQISFIDAVTEAQVRKRCAKTSKKDLLSTRQKWLGAYYARDMEKGDRSGLIVKWIDETLGWGVFTEVPIPKGSYIGIYSGVVRKRRLWGDQRNHYCFEYKIGEEGRSKYLIDAEKRGGLVRFINHSDQPNLEPLSVYENGLVNIILISTQTIPAGTQLSYDYGEDYWAKRGPCRALYKARFA